MPKTLFRQEAMDRLGSPEQLDTLMRVVSPRRWVALAVAGVILAGAVVWGFVGRLDSTARTSCVVIPRGGTYSIETATAGTVSSVLVQRGAHVNAGETVAIIETANGPKVPVEAPFSGTVIELLSTHGDYVSVGGQLVSFESDEEALGVLMYVSPAVSASLHRGMTVRVSPATASRDQYGFLLGTVDEVAPYPSTHDGISSLLHNDTLTDQLVAAAGGTPVEVWVAPQKADTPSGFRWSSSEGPAKLRSGATCTADIVLGERRPIDLIR